MYTYWVQAEDVAGNLAEVGPYTVKVLGAPVLNKTVTPQSEVQLGNTVLYTLTLSNVNNELLENVILRDELPAGGRPLTQTAGSVYLPPVGNTLTWGPYTVPPGDTWGFAFSAVVTDSLAYAGRTLTNTATLQHAGNVLTAQAMVMIEGGGSQAIYLPLVLKQKPATRSFDPAGARHPLDIATRASDSSCPPYVPDGVGLEYHKLALLES